MRLFQGLITILAGLALLAPVAAAQSASGGSAPPKAVEVDLSVIDKIKRRPRGVAPGEPIRLRPLVGDGTRRRAVRTPTRTTTRKASVGTSRATTVGTTSLSRTPAETPKQAGPSLPNRAQTKAPDSPPKQPDPKQPEAAAKPPEAKLPPSTASRTPPPLSPPPPPPRSLLFAEGSADLQGPAAAQLDRVLGYLSANTGSRVQVTGFAPGEGTEAAAARRLSLARARAAQGYLIRKGVDGARIFVRALGNKAGTANPDSVDVTILKQ